MPQNTSTPTHSFSLHGIVDWLAARPLLFDSLRWILEAGYTGEKGVLRKEGFLKGRRVLDLGCGTGAMASFFRPENYLGVDINARYIDWALRKNSKYQFRVMDGTRLNFDDGYFDFVFIGGVIHHLGDDLALAMLREAKRILRPQDGVFLIWEDIPTRSQFNWIGKWVHRLDEGDHIRQEDHYLRLVGSVFKPLKHYLMRSGVCDYSVMVFRNDFNSGSV